ncbi:MAG: hypothetical protein IJ462_03300 [Clostridia bacterium]|nr:hypothetical protein [Clostridia bacterium]
MKKVIMLLIVGLLIFNLCGCGENKASQNSDASQNVSSSFVPPKYVEIDADAARNAALKYIEDSYKLALKSGYETLWSEKTAISKETPTYDPYGNVNGYIYHLKNDDTSAGYVQVFCFDDFIRAVSSSFGDLELDKMFERFDKAAQTDDRLKNFDKTKILYVGSIELWIKSPDGAVYGLKSGDYSDPGSIELIFYEQYEALKNNMR